MSGLAADIIGIIGSILFVSAFAYANMAKELNKLWFNVANLLGAILLLISLSVHFNLAAFLLEVAWAVIALGGIIGALRKKPESLR
jgi:predicted membrane protein